ncbi:hypothetical protein BCU68_00640 [Vibrio sp. 10N.286.49.B3]|uniref:carboxylesterase family protein n=1 Tax=Vibrio sp. 10N.286.49.B3 TaxID=1880855 RepID=UPI000C815155|nr:carboxylesterase family protein [Vibrio sp. 10N.286.49.B3]PMH46587.1 hypothetical protein BCU68_00640 [Vibrio sp. 10N.286.49.B3]
MKWILRTSSVLILGVLASGCTDDPGELTFTPTPSPELPGPEELNLQIREVDVTATLAPVTITSINGEENSINIEEIKGIPYAYSERFEHSELLPISSLAQQQPFDATKFGDVCPQLNTDLAMSEACLNLNIWRPEGTVEGDDLPVFVYMHGGSFETGSGQSVDIIPDIIVAQSVSDTELGRRDTPFIAITLNYRLGLLGTLWQEDNGDTKGGNFGIGDQKRALQWVKENISYFGGTAENITIFGQGAGATAVNIMHQVPDPVIDTLNIDNAAGQYFHKSIMQSLPFGIPFKSYSLAKDTNETIAAILENEDYSGKTLEDLSVDELLTIQSQVKSEITGRLFGLPDGTVEEIITDILDWIEAGDSTAAIGIKLTAKYATTIAAIESRAKMIAFAPYLESHRECISSGIFGCKEYADYTGYHVTQQAMDTKLTVSSVVGFNSDNSNSYTAAFKIPFLINLEIIDGINIIDIVQWLLNNDSILPTDIDEFITYSDDSINIPVYTILSAIIHLDNIDALSLSDFSPAEDDTNLTGIKENMSKFNALNNQLIFKCEARDFIQRNSSDENITMYHFDYIASFNTNILDDSLLGTLGNLSCFSGKACNKAETPFIFNRLYNERGSVISPTDVDSDLIQEVSRLWFSDALFENYAYVDANDNALMIHNISDGENDIGKIEEISDWDSSINYGVDSQTLDGICGAIYD